MCLSCCLPACALHIIPIAVICCSLLLVHSFFVCTQALYGERMANKYSHGNESRWSFTSFAAFLSVRRRKHDFRNDADVSAISAHSTMKIWIFRLKLEEWLESMYVSAGNMSSIASSWPDTCFRRKICLFRQLFISLSAGKFSSISLFNSIFFESFCDSLLLLPPGSTRFQFVSPISLWLFSLLFLSSNASLSI